jgi:uncharacterized membrane protein
MPFSPLHLLLFLALLGFLIAFIQVGLITVMFQKLGLSPSAAFVLLFGSLFGSAINLPLFSIEARLPPPGTDVMHRGLLRTSRRRFTGRTLIAANVGGCVIPVVFCLYLLFHRPLNLSAVVIAVTIVSAASYAISRPIAGIGIGMPVFVAPITAALVAALLGGEATAPPLAYIAGTLGVLIGADLMRLKDVQTIGTPMASIGGAGTFDGIFLSGLVAVLLA